MPKRQTPINVVQTDKDEWYTAGEGAKVLSANSGREVKPDYLSKLGSLGKIRTKKINPRLTFYHKQDVDAYRVEDRGVKSGEAKKAGARGKPPIQTTGESEKTAA